MGALVPAVAVGPVPPPPPAVEADRAAVPVEEGGGGEEEEGDEDSYDDADCGVVAAAAAAVGTGGFCSPPRSGVMWVGKRIAWRASWAGVGLRAWWNTCAGRRKGWFVEIHSMLFANSGIPLRIMVYIESVGIMTIRKTKEGHVDELSDNKDRVQREGDEKGKYIRRGFFVRHRSFSRVPGRPFSFFISHHSEVEYCSPLDFHPGSTHRHTFTLTQTRTGCPSREGPSTGYQLLHGLRPGMAPAHALSGRVR